MFPVVKSAKSKLTIADYYSLCALIYCNVDFKSLLWFTRSCDVYEVLWVVLLSCPISIFYFWFKDPLLLSVTSPAVWPLSLMHCIWKRTSYLSSRTAYEKGSHWSFLILIRGPCFKRNSLYCWCIMAFLFSALESFKGLVLLVWIV